MTKEQFENILKRKNIKWGELVEIIILNPNYKRFSRRPKTILFYGALSYYIDSQIVGLFTSIFIGSFEDVYDEYFDFKDIIGIKKANREGNKKYGI